MAEEPTTEGPICPPLLSANVSRTEFTPSAKQRLHWSRQRSDQLFLPVVCKRFWNRVHPERETAAALEELIVAGDQFVPPIVCKRFPIRIHLQRETTVTLQCSLSIHRCGMKVFWIGS